MKFSVFSKRSNPSIDRPIVRKSLSYIEAQVAEGRADWVDAFDHGRGIVCRELLNLGPRPETTQPTTSSMGEIPGLRFEEPPSVDYAHRVQSHFFPNLAPRATVMAIERRQALAV